MNPKVHHYTCSFISEDICNPAHIVRTCFLKPFIFPGPFQDSDWFFQNSKNKTDKTTNHYKTEPKEYMTPVDKNVTKGYKKADRDVPDAINSVDKKVAVKLGLDDRIEVSANRDSFITMKDHKPDFMNNPTSRLINPSKSEIGIISKQILDNINKKVIHATQVNQWKSTSNVIQWFQAIPEKKTSMPSSPSTYVTSVRQSQSNSL